jgi:hypothetical protein
MVLRCAANVACCECGTPWSVTFGWFADAAPSESHATAFHMSGMPESIRMAAPARSGPWAGGTPR